LKHLGMTLFVATVLVIIAAMLAWSLWPTSP
jgi:regulatory protein YycH of two-component signal transduction system YycFG